MQTMRPESSSRVSRAKRALLPGTRRLLGDGTDRTPKTKGARRFFEKYLLRREKTKKRKTAQA